jgi:hypothetical protein
MFELPDCREGIASTHREVINDGDRLAMASDVGADTWLSVCDDADHQTDAVGVQR